DRISEQVMRLPAPDVALTSSPPQVNRKCAECQEEKRQEKSAATDDVISRDRSVGDEVPHSPGGSMSTLDPGPTFEAGLAAARSAGARVDPSIRSFMELRFGLDFSQVRIHADTRAAALASSIHAEAFTLGQDIFFALGRYDPASQGGRELLA